MFDRRRGLLGLAAAGLLLLAGDTVRASDEKPRALSRVRGREATLGHQAEATATLARQQLGATYRLVRRGQLRFAGAPQTRLQDTHVRDTALMAVARTVGEAQALEHERSRLETQRAALEVVAAARDDRPRETPRWTPPVRGAVVTTPGWQRDAGTGVAQPEVGLRYLARLNEPIKAPATGTVRALLAQPQGGFAVVLAHHHEGGWISVLAGFRDLDVSVGQVVQTGQVLGACGRTLDGAPVLLWEVYQGRRAVDPRDGLGAPPGRATAQKK